MAMRLLLFGGSGTVEMKLVLLVLLQLQWGGLQSLTCVGIKTLLLEGSGSLELSDLLASSKILGSTTWMSEILLLLCTIFSLSWFDSC